MEPLRAVRVDKPKRTSSVPGSLRRPAHRRSIPQALVDALCAARERFGRFGVSPPAEAAAPPPPDAGARGATQAAEEEEGRGAHARQPQLESSPPVPEVSAATPSSSGAVADIHAAATEPAEGEEAGQGTATAAAAAAAAAAPKVRLTASETCIPYGVAVTREAMQRLKHVVGHCPEKTAVFLEHLREVVATTVPDIPAAPVPTASRGKGGSSAHFTARQLEALSELWGNRREAPVSVSTTIGRKRGLFGDLEPKQLHQHVISVLNRVSNETRKYR
ncbi:putative eukaryotic initiation factor 4a, partial [Trypanosoma conorhini]